MNNLHKAAVTAGKDYKRCQTANWLRSDQTKELITTIETDPKKRGTEQKQAVNLYQGGNGVQGTFVAKERVHAYAVWISPAFQSRVIRAYDAMATAAPAFDPNTLSRLELLQLARVAETVRLPRAKQRCMPWNRLRPAARPARC